MTTIQRHELEAWLGPALQDLTEAQVERVHRAAERIHARYPGEDQGVLRDAATKATVDYLAGDLTIERAGVKLIWARIAEREASVVAQQVAVLAVEDGATEVAAASAAGIDRNTLRKALGK